MFKFWRFYKKYKALAKRKNQTKNLKFLISFFVFRHLFPSCFLINDPADNQLTCSYTREYAQTILIYQRPSFSRDLCWLIKFQIFCDQTINSPYIYI